MSRIQAPSDERRAGAEPSPSDLVEATYEAHRLKGKLEKLEAQRWQLFERLELPDGPWALRAVLPLARLLRFVERAFVRRPASPPPATPPADDPERLARSVEDGLLTLALNAAREKADKPERK